MIDASFFPGASLNYAENILEQKDLNKPAIISYTEAGKVTQKTFLELKNDVLSLAAELSKIISKNNVTAGILPNQYEAVAAFLATSCIGAIWTSVSPDFGKEALLDRLEQTKPEVIFSVSSYTFKGKVFDIKSKVREVARKLNAKIIWCDDCDLLLNTESLLKDLIKNKTSNFNYVRLPFSHPLHILYSSGSTGKPKCIVHSQGGALIEHKKEHILHGNLQEKDVIFYQTTLSWMMWNWLIRALSVGSTILLFDGSPLVVDLFEIAEKENVTIFGTNAGFLKYLEQEKISPNTKYKLNSLHTLLSTGSPLLTEQYTFIKEHIKKDLNISSISGGTDIVGCFALGCPEKVIPDGHLKMRSLGLKVEVWSEDGKPVVNQKGDLVCTAPFPSMPLYFWGDTIKEKYRKTYFERFPGVWHHGDFVELKDDGSMIFYGRSDATLKPGGVRIGSAEIYRPLSVVTEILDSLVIGRELNGNVEIVLFVVLSKGTVLDDVLKTKIKNVLRINASPHHVPKYIFQLSGIPKTRNGKSQEVLVKTILGGDMTVAIDDELIFKEILMIRDTLKN